jgi:hypothetical protein
LLHLRTVLILPRTWTVIGEAERAGLAGCPGGGRIPIRGGDPRNDDERW